MRVDLRILFVLLALGFGLTGITQTARALPVGVPTLSSTTVTVGNTITVTASWTPDEPGGSVASLQASPAIGVFSSATLTANNDGQSIGGTGTLQLTITDNDVDLIPEQTTVQAIFLCNTAGATNFTITHAGTTSSQSGTLTCSPAGGGGAGGVGIVSVTASPNALICGGTSTITAYTRDTTTGALIPGVFHFTTGTTGTDSLHQGQLIQQTDNTAILALLPGHLTTTVTASTVGIIPGGRTDSAGNPVPEVISGTVVVQNYCGEQATEPIAVVAAPNVIACGGTAKITATARDLSGIIIPGTGFTFTTDYGVLIVGPPNTAASTSGTATLTLQPGMGAEDPSGTSPGIRFATVTAQLGAKVGTVKVQQFCPGVTTDSSTAPGRIVLNPSQTAISCNGSAFIGAVIKDSKGQVPEDETEVTFLATSGKFSAASQSGTGSSQQSVTRPSGTPSASSTPSTTTTTVTSGEFLAKKPRNGALNVIYNAGPESNGQVSITAAAGAAFGTTTITVNCPTAIAAGASGAGGAFRPPSTGEGLIKPPNTGDAGLVVE